jgi:hypothetical protein
VLGLKLRKNGEVGWFVIYSLLVISIVWALIRLQSNLFFMITSLPFSFNEDIRKQTKALKLVGL